MDPKGEANVDAEAVVAQVTASVDTSSLGVGADELVKLQVENEHLQAICKYLQDGSLPFGGHFAAKGLYNTILHMYWWDGMFGDVVRWCRSCLMCSLPGL